MADKKDIMKKIKSALISVFDKSNLKLIARKYPSFRINIYILVFPLSV